MVLHIYQELQLQTCHHKLITISNLEKPIAWISTPRRPAKPSIGDLTVTRLVPWIRKPCKLPLVHLQRPPLTPLRAHFHGSSYSLTRLRSLAFHRQKLDENWSCSLPVVCGEIKVIATNYECKIICLVPGTGAILMYTPNQRCLVCFDVATKLRFRNRLLLTADFGPLFDVTISVPQEESPGQFKLALLTSELRVSSP